MALQDLAPPLYIGRGHHHVAVKPTCLTRGLAKGFATIHGVGRAGPAFRAAHATTNDWLNIGGALLLVKRWKAPSVKHCKSPSVKHV